MTVGNGANDPNSDTYVGARGEVWKKIDRIQDDDILVTSHQGVSITRLQKLYLEYHKMGDEFYSSFFPSEQALALQPDPAEWKKQQEALIRRINAALAAGTYKDTGVRLESPGSTVKVPVYQFTAPIIDGPRVATTHEKQKFTKEGVLLDDEFDIMEGDAINPEGWTESERNVAIGLAIAGAAAVFLILGVYWKILSK